MGCDVIIAIGGGSCLDAAKGIAILTGNGGQILDYAGVDPVTRPIPPLLMIPSTAGTGADVSQFCIITDTASKVKVTIMGRALVPEISVTDPRLLSTMPADLAAATGLDALTHGIEAYVSCVHNPLADGHALSAVRLAFGNLPRIGRAGTGRGRLRVLHQRELLDAERHRIALELHDSVAQHVLSAGLAVDVCRAEAADRGDDADVQRRGRPAGSRP